jgi:sigma-B regulation protein RsbU (phosphoserine phosphatase)
MQSLIDNLLDLARGRLGGGLSLARDAGASLQPLLESVIAEQKASFPGRVIETVIALTGSVNCDRQRVAQLFSNLLSNALTYGSEEDPVLVRILSDDAGVFELSVANGGKPIPAAALKRLFQPFYRNAVEQNREGLGLGLYISHEIARAHGGTLEVESNSEQTRFTFRMPAK